MTDRKTLPSADKRQIVENIMTMRPTDARSNADNRMAKALSVAQQIEKRVAVTLAPLEREMGLMQWRPEFRVIMWEAVANAALKYAEEASRESASPDK